MKPVKPVLGRVAVADATCESLAPILQRNPRGVMLIKDELSGWARSCGQYKGGKGNDRQFWLENWAGVPASIDRKSQDCVPIIVPHPFVGVVGGIQPDMLGELVDAHGRADGSLDRILFAYPDAGPAPEWTWDDLPADGVKPWHDTVEGLLALNMAASDGGVRPYLVKLTPDARPAGEQAVNRLTAEMNADAFPPHLRGVWAKLKVYLARLALVLHFIRFVNKEADQQDVDGESVRRAGVLVDYFKAHARKVLAAMGSDRRAAQARRILLALCRPPHRELSQFTRTELYKILRGSFDQPELLERPLALLVARGYLQPVSPKRPEGSRGPNPPRYLVNPLWDRDPGALVSPVTPVSGGEDGPPETCATGETSASGEVTEEGGHPDPAHADGTTKGPAVTPGRADGPEGGVSGVWTADGYNDLDNPFAAGVVP